MYGENSVTIKQADNGFIVCKYGDSPDDKGKEVIATTLEEAMKEVEGMFSIMDKKSKEKVPKNDEELKEMTGAKEEEE